MHTGAHAHTHTRAHTRTQVIANMSPSLQEEVTQKVHGVWLKKLRFLTGAEPGCLVRIALRMEPRVFAPTDVPEGGRLYVISTGIVLNYDGWNAQGRVLGEGRVCMHVWHACSMHAHTHAHTCTRAWHIHPTHRCGGWRASSSIATSGGCHRGHDA